MIDVGDKVVCINDLGLDTPSPVKCGQTYTVRAVYGEFIDVGVTNCLYPGYFAWRFLKHRDSLASRKEAAEAANLLAA